MTQTCAQHPDVAALYVCDGCEKTLCGDCISEGHALLFCRLCGERAMPLHAEQPATVKELTRRRVISRPYSLTEALSYPFRGSGLMLYVATVLASGVVWVLTFFGGCYALILSLLFSGLIVGLQFKIVRSTAEGENELPDWPDFTDVGTLVRDLLTSIVINLPVFVVILAGFAAIGADVLAMMGIVSGFEPRLDFWIAFAAFLWLAVAFLVMGFGSVGNYRRLKVFEVHNHVRGFLVAGADAVKITNLVFGLGAATFLIQALLESIPYAGQAFSGIVGVYWTFMAPHLAGLLFRRHGNAMDKLYWPAGALGF